jgi:predicted permease
VLLFRSVRNSARIDLGFDPDRVAVVSFNLRTLGYDGARADQFYRALLGRARELAVVERAALADFVPMGGRGGAITAVNPLATPASGQDQVSAAYNRVSDDYFATVGQPLIRGRGFRPTDRPGAPLVAIVNEALARRFWPNDDPVGKRLRMVSEPGDRGTEREIVGVTKDARYRLFGGEVGPFVFIPVLEGIGLAQTLHIRVAANPSRALAEIDGLVRAIDASVVPQGSQTMREAMSFALVPARLARTVLGVAAVIALVLATGGLYGLVCYTLEQRLKEIGIRIALGASREVVFRLLVGGAVRLAAVGVVFGLLLGAGAARLLTSLLVGLGPTDPATFAGIGGLLIFVTLVAGFAAARKGLNVDPMVVLRNQ